MDKRSAPLVSICRVERGMYTLRYIEALTSPSPVADITVLSGDVSIVPAPGRATLALRAPGQTMVILAETPGEFEIKVTAARGDSTDAKFGVELLDAGEQRRVEMSTPAPDRSMEAHRSADVYHSRQDLDDGGSLSVRAHVSRRGDVLVGAEEWVAGPDEVLPIEGLSIATGRQDLNVRIRVQSAKSGHRWSRWHDAGEFAGSRQQADPLTAIALALTGDGAAHVEVSAEVMALGRPLTTKRGKIVEFFGVDPIVGFRLTLQNATTASEGKAASSTPPLRVFRAKR